jgi:hypothetical protein
MKTPVPALCPLTSKNARGVRDLGVLDGGGASHYGDGASLSRTTETENGVTIAREKNRRGLMGES